MQPPPIPTPGSPGVPMAYAHPVHTDDGSSQARPDAGGRVAPSRGRTRPRGGGGLLSCCGGKPKRRESAGVGVPAVRACAIHPPPSPAILTVIASNAVFPRPELSVAGVRRRALARMPVYSTTRPPSTRAALPVPAPRRRPRRQWRSRRCRQGAIRASSRGVVWLCSHPRVFAPRWSVAYSRSDQAEYYVNDETGETQWERPS